MSLFPRSFGILTNHRHSRGDSSSGGRRDAIDSERNTYRPLFLFLHRRRRRPHPLPRERARARASVPAEYRDQPRRSANSFFAHQRAAGHPSVRGRSSRASTTTDDDDDGDLRVVTPITTDRRRETTGVTTRSSKSLAAVAARHFAIIALRHPLGAPRSVSSEGKVEGDRRILVRFLAFPSRSRDPLSSSGPAGRTDRSPATRVTSCSRRGASASLFLSLSFSLSLPRATRARNPRINSATACQGARCVGGMLRTLLDHRLAYPGGPTGKAPRRLTVRGGASCSARRAREAASCRMIHPLPPLDLPSSFSRHRRFRCCPTHSRFRASKSFWPGIEFISGQYDLLRYQIRRVAPLYVDDRAIGKAAQIDILPTISGDAFLLIYLNHFVNCRGEYSRSKTVVTSVNAYACKPSGSNVLCIKRGAWNCNFFHRAEFHREFRPRIVKLRT